VTDVGTELPSAIAPDDRPATVIRREPSPRDRDPRRFHRGQRRIDWALAWGVPVVLLAAWQVAGNTGHLDSKFFPVPSQIWTTGVDMVRAGVLRHDLWVSLRRILEGLGLGFVTGLVAGFGLGIWRRARVALEPVLSALYTVPKLAMLPLLLLVFGIGETPLVLTIGITVFFFVWISAMEAVTSVDERYRQAAQSFGAGPFDMVRHVLIPASLPEILVGLRVAAGVAVLVDVGVEFVQANDGLGHRVWFSWSLFEARPMYVGIVVIALLGVVLTFAVKSIARLLIPWASTPAPRQRR
jgi:NitT/TauT family transport system permease protein/sulfonate transport system permease protein